MRIVIMASIPKQLCTLRTYEKQRPTIVFKFKTWFDVKEDANEFAPCFLTYKPSSTCTDADYDAQKCLRSLDLANVLCSTV